MKSIFIRIFQNKMFDHSYSYSFFHHQNHPVPGQFVIIFFCFFNFFWIFNGFHFTKFTKTYKYPLHQNYELWIMINIPKFVLGCHRVIRKMRPWRVLKYHKETSMLTKVICIVSKFITSMSCLWIYGYFSWWFFIFVSFHTFFLQKKNAHLFANFRTTIGQFAKIRNLNGGLGRRFAS